MAAEQPQNSDDRSPGEKSGPIFDRASQLPHDHADGDLLVEFELRHADALVSMWRSSFERALNITDPHPLDEQKQYLMSEVVPNNSVRIVLRGPNVAGFIAATPDSIAQLYVNVDYQGQGIGSRLLNWAKLNSAGSLWLYTFERNRHACKFYERHGFQVVARGFEEQWQLDDLKLVWNQIRQA